LGQGEKEYMNPAEVFISKLCEKTFLSLWSYPNPKRTLDPNDKDKELCDIIVVCEPDVIIFSVKEIKVTEHKEAEVGEERWRRKAIGESFKQIYGAERYINNSDMKNVITKDGETGLPLPGPSVRKIHRVAVALGSGGKIEYLSENFGKGYVHIFDDSSIETIMTELDTISDFVKFLDDTEGYYEGKTERSIVCEGSMKDVLAFYLKNGRKYLDEETASKYDWVMVHINEGLWDELTSYPEYLAKKKEDEQSYGWDFLIEKAYDLFKSGAFEGDDSIVEFEQALRVMALENRFSRRILQKGIDDFINQDLRGRYMKSLSGVSYALMLLHQGDDPQEKQLELYTRCLITREIYPENPTVIGIAFGKSYDKKSIVLCGLRYYHQEVLTEQEKEIIKIAKESGCIDILRRTHFSEDEYPKTENNPKS